MYSKIYEAIRKYLSGYFKRENMKVDEIINWVSANNLKISFASSMPGAIIAVPISNGQSLIVQKYPVPNHHVATLLRLSPPYKIAIGASESQVLKEVTSPLCCPTPVLYKYCTTACRHPFHKCIHRTQASLFTGIVLISSILRLAL